MKHGEFIKEIVDAKEGECPALQYEVIGGGWANISTFCSDKSSVISWLVSTTGQRHTVRKKPIQIPDKVYYDVTYIGEGAFDRRARRIKITVKTDENNVVTETVEFA